MATTIPFQLRNLAQIRSSHDGEVHRGVMVVLLSGVSVGILLQLWNATVLQQSWPHLVTLAWSLLVSLILFIRFVTVFWREEPRKD